MICFFFFQAEDGIRDDLVTGVQTCALPICSIFTGWGGACSGTLTCSVTMNAAQTVTATFNQQGANLGLRFVPVTPCRVADTRNPVGPFGGPFLSSQTFRDFGIPNSACNIPVTAQA